MADNVARPAGAPRRERRVVKFGHIEVDVVSFAEALDAIAELVTRREGGTVFTPNIDHVVIAEDDAQFRAAYADASLSLVDGKPLLWAAQLLGTKLPEKISGSDLIAPLMQRAAASAWSVYLLGAGPGVAEAAKAALERNHPGLRIVGTSSPRIDLSQSSAEQRELLDVVRTARPDIVLVALGAPKQEIWSHRVASELSPAVLVGIGASLDFVAGTVKRAPAWMSAAGFEWLYRLAREPRRMGRRYLIRDPKFLKVLLRDVRAHRRSERAGSRRADDQ